MLDFPIDRAKTAVLCMDMHTFIVGNVPEPQKSVLLSATPRVLNAARQAGVVVIYVEARRRPSFSSPRNKFTSAVRPAVSPAEAVERMKIVPQLAPLEGEPVVHKPRMSAFYGSELQTMLTARDIDTIVLTGVATNFVVESTARYAVDADYRVIVLRDCCAAHSDEAHARALANMDPLVHIATSEDFLASLA